MSVFEARIVASADDAEQRISNNQVNITSGQLDLGDAGSDMDYVGLRYQTVTIPNGATIDTAYIEFVATDPDSAAVSLNIYAQDADNPVTFTTAVNDISSRTPTTAQVAWSPGTWVADATYQTPELKTIIQEIVDRAGWVNSNSLVIVFNLTSGTGRRRGTGYSLGGSTTSPLLHVEYTHITSASDVIAVAAGTDDAEEVDWSGDVSLTGTSASFENYTAFRFQALNIPQGSIITAADIEFAAAFADSGSCSVEIFCQDTDDAATFTSGAHDISSRTRTAASVVWTPASWTAGFAYSTNDLKAIFQEVIDRPGWVSGNDVVVIIKPDTLGARRRFATYEHSTYDPPTLTIAWDIGDYHIEASDRVAGSYAVVNAEARHSIGTPKDMGGAGAFATVVTTVTVAPPAGGIDIGYGYATIRLSMRHSLHLVSRGYGYETLRLPKPLYLTATDRSTIRDVVIAVAATKKSISGVDFVAASFASITASLKSVTPMEASDRPARSYATITTTLTAGAPIDPTLDPPGHVMGIIHQLNLAYRSIYGP